MKHLKAMSVLLSAAMLVSMVTTPVSVLADETEASSETAATERVEETEKKEEKETEKKPASKEEEETTSVPSEPEETTKEEPAGTDKQEPASEEDEAKKPEENEEQEAKDPVAVDEPEAEEERKDAMDAIASGKCGKNVKWTLDSAGTMKITGSGAMYNYSEPFVNDDRPWKLYICSIKKVVISKGVTTVGDYAFCFCGELASVSLPDGLKAINKYAFTICNLTKVSIPKGVTKIDMGAFMDCESLKSVNIPASVTEIGYGAFQNCIKLSVVNIPVSGLRIIGERAFEYCNSLTRFDIPLSVLEIGDFAFSEIVDLTVTVSESLRKDLKLKSFGYCPHIDIQVRYEAALFDTFEYNGIKYTVTDPKPDGTGTVTVTEVPENLETVAVPSVVTNETDTETKNETVKVTYKVTRIDTNAFRNHEALKKVVIGSNVLIIDDLAFQGCTNLVSVTGGARLKTIGAKAFISCPKLKVFSITSTTLWKIGTYAFYGDKSLKTLQVKKTTKLVKSGVKKSLKGSSVKTVKVKKSKVKKYKKYFTKKNCGKKVKVKK